MGYQLFYKSTILILTILGSCITGFSQKTIADWQAELKQATTAKAKADACFEIAVAYSNFLKIDSALFFANKVKEYSQQAKYETGIGKYYLAYASAIFYRGQDKESEENAQKAIKIFVRQNDNILLGRAYVVIGSNLSEVATMDLARKNFWTAINYFALSDNALGLYYSYRWLAYSYFKTSEIDSASFYHIKGLAIAERLNDAEKICQSACWVGSIFLNLGEPDKAVNYFNYGLKFRTAQTDKISLRLILTDYATSLILTHKFPAADSVMIEIESLNVLFKDDYGQMLINRIRGASEYERKNYRQAIQYLKQASDDKNKFTTVMTEIKDVVLLLGKAEYAINDYDSGISHLELAANMCKQLGELFDEGEASLLISRSFQQKGNADSALHYFKHYTVLKDSILSQQKQKNIIEITTRYETEKKIQAINILQKESEANSYLIELKNQQIEKQQLENVKKTQQLQLLSQQNEISRLEAAQKNLALQNQGKEMVKKQNEFSLLSKESQLQAAIAAKENQQKKFAYAAMFAVLFFGTIIFYRYRQSRKLGLQLSSSLVLLKDAQDQLVKTEKEKEAENIRVRISRDIHDEVGATLSGVALFSEIAIQKMEANKAADVQVYLNQISANSKEMVEKMSDIVWAINPDNDSFERIIAKLQSYAFNLCAGKGIKLHLDIDHNIRNDQPDMQVKRDLYLFMKEAVNNAVKYSGGSNLFLSLQRKSDSVIATIKDDGKGFDSNLAHVGNGLKNMKARADSLNAAFAIDSIEGMGTSVRLQFQYHPSGGQSLSV